jgi:hypothetical protein
MTKVGRLLPHTTNRSNHSPKVIYWFRKKTLNVLGSALVCQRTYGHRARDEDCRPCGLMIVVHRAVTGSMLVSLILFRFRPLFSFHSMEADVLHGSYRRYLLLHPLSIKIPPVASRWHQPPLNKPLLIASRTIPDKSRQKPCRG